MRNLYCNYRRQGRARRGSSAGAWTARCWQFGALNDVLKATVGSLDEAICSSACICYLNGTPTGLQRSVYSHDAARCCLCMGAMEGLMCWRLVSPLLSWRCLCVPCTAACRQLNVAVPQTIMRLCCLPLQAPFKQQLEANAAALRGPLLRGACWAPAREGLLGDSAVRRHQVRGRQGGGGRPSCSCSRPRWGCSPTQTCRWRAHAKTLFWRCLCTD